jgi:hypothetical protein
MYAVWTISDAEFDRDEWDMSPLWLVPDDGCVQVIEEVTSVEVIDGKVQVTYANGGVCKDFVSDPAHPSMIVHHLPIGARPFDEVA